MPARRRTLSVLVGVVSALAVLSACSSSGSQPAAGPTTPPSSSKSPSARPSPSTPTASIAPLTGLPTSALTAQRHAVAVVVSANPGHAAPVGLGDADLIYAEYADGGTVRLITVFQSRDAARVGPITSTRPTDPKLLAVLHGCIAYDGGTSGFLKELVAAKLCQLTPTGASAAFSGAPGSRYAAVAPLYAAAGGPGTPPPAISAFATAGQQFGSGVRQAGRLTVGIPGHGQMVWTYDAVSRMWRSVVDGTSVAVTTVEVLVMPYKAVPVQHPPGVILSATVLGRGAATVVSGPACVSGTWYRPGPSALTNVVDGAQHLIHPLVGSTWVMLARTGSTIQIG